MKNANDACMLKINDPPPVQLLSVEGTNYFQQDLERYDRVASGEVLGSSLVLCAAPLRKGGMRLSRSAGVAALVSDSRKD